MKEDYVETQPKGENLKRFERTQPRSKKYPARSLPEAIIQLGEASKLIDHILTWQDLSLIRRSHLTTAVNHVDLALAAIAKAEGRQS